MASARVRSSSSVNATLTRHIWSGMDTSGRRSAPLTHAPACAVAMEDSTRRWSYDRVMGERTSYAPGTLSWAELATSDADAAKGFYAAVFGWNYEDHPVGDGQVYSVARRDARRVAALFASDEPPHWNCYVTVESVDDSTPRAAELGATVLAEPFDVMDVGRMSVIADPTGAALCLWEARTSIGAEL